MVVDRCIHFVSKFTLCCLCTTQLKIRDVTLSQSFLMTPNIIFIFYIIIINICKSIASCKNVLWSHVYRKFLLLMICILNCTCFKLLEVVLCILWHLLLFWAQLTIVNKYLIGSLVYTRINVKLQYAFGGKWKQNRFSVTHLQVRFHLIWKQRNSFLSTLILLDIEDAK